MQGEALPDSTQRDNGHLKILAIFYYIFSAISALLIILGILYLLFVPGPIQNPNDAAEVASAQAADPIIYGVGSGLIIGGIIGALLYFFTARGLATYRYRGLVILVAILSLFSFLLGTILGVFTLVVITRPSVKGRFGAG